MTLLAVAVGLLAVLTALNLFILLGVVRRLRTMPASTGATPPPDVLPPAGTRIGPFNLTAVDGRTVTEADLATGTSLVVLLSPSCSPCQDTAHKLASQRDILPASTFVLIRTELDEPDLDAMLATLEGVGTVATFHGGDGIQEAFTSRGYPAGILVRDGVVEASSFTYYTDLLPEAVGV